VYQAIRVVKHPMTQGAITGIARTAAPVGSRFSSIRVRLHKGAHARLSSSFRGAGEGIEPAFSAWERILVPVVRRANREGPTQWRPCGPLSVRNSVRCHLVVARIWHEGFVRNEVSW
jgi:hypothetical protein